MKLAEMYDMISKLYDMHVSILTEIPGMLSQMRRTIAMGKQEVAKHDSTPAGRRSRGDAGGLSGKGRRRVSQEDHERTPYRHQHAKFEKDRFGYL